MTWIEPITLAGAATTLVPLAHAHTADLAEASRDGELWRLWYTSVPSPEKMASEIDRRLALQASGSMLPFTVFDNASASPVGMTTFMNIDHANRRLEIGST